MQTQQPHDVARLQWGEHQIALLDSLKHLRAPLRQASNSTKAPPEVRAAAQGLAGRIRVGIDQLRSAYGAYYRFNPDGSWVGAPRRSRAWHQLLLDIHKAIVNFYVDLNSTAVPQWKRTLEVALKKTLEAIRTHVEWMGHPPPAADLTSLVVVACMRPLVATCTRAIELLDADPRHTTAWLRDPLAQVPADALRVSASLTDPTEKAQEAARQGIQWLDTWLGRVFQQRDGWPSDGVHVLDFGPVERANDAIGAWHRAHREPRSPVTKSESASAESTARTADSSAPHG